MESIGEDLRIRVSDIFSDFCECMCPFIDRAQDKYRPLLPDQSEESSRVRACALGCFYHRAYNI